MAALEGYVLSECLRIAWDENETPARRRLAREWASRLEASADCWGNDGQTKAEAAGIAVDPKAPGGQKVYTGGGAQRLSNGAEDQFRTDVDYNG